MIRAIIKTPTPKHCIIKESKPATIIFKQIWLDSKGVKAIVSFKTPEETKTMVVREHECCLARAILELGAIIVSAVVNHDDVVWNIVCTADEFKDLINRIEELNFKYDILWKAEFFDESDLSYKEFEILRLALEKGFFENPKRVRLEDLAKELEISTASASDLLRRALKKVVKNYLESI